MSESLRNDGRVWVPKTAGDKRPPDADPGRGSRLLSSSASIRASATWCRATSRRGTRRQVCDEGRGVGAERPGRLPRFRGRDQARSGSEVIAERYGNLFDMYQQDHRRGPVQGADADLPAMHYTMGGLWVDYNLMSNLPGLHVLGEANFSDHGANRLGASALMQGLCGRLLRHPLHARATTSPAPKLPAVTTDHDAFRGRRARRSQARIERLLSIKGERTPRQLASRARHASCGTTWGCPGRDEGLRKALAQIPQLREEFWQNVTVPGTGEQPEQGARVRRARGGLPRIRANCWPWTRCNGPNRAAATSARKARRRTAKRCATMSISRTSRRGSSRASGKAPALHKEPLEFEYVQPIAAKLQMKGMTRRVSDMQRATVTDA